MASNTLSAALPNGAEPLTSEMAETDRYFLRRRQQLAATIAQPRTSIPTGSQGPIVADCPGGSPVETTKRVGPEVFPSPFREEVSTDSKIAKEFVEIFTKAEDEMDGLAGKDLDGLREVILAQRCHIETLQGELQRQHQFIQQQQSELQQHKSDAADARALVEQQRMQLKELTSQAEAATAIREKQAQELQEQRRRLADLEEQLEKCLNSSKEAAALHQKDTEHLQQMRRQQSSLARHIRATKSGESAAKEAALAARHAAELRKVTTQRDTLVDVVKKQFKLIEVLKQQKAHLEAARYLQFTEEEFLKIIDSERQLKKQQGEPQQQQQLEEHLQKQLQQQHERLQDMESLQEEADQSTRQ